MAQLPVNEETGKVVFTDVVQADGMTKEQIYEKAKMWIVSTLKSGDNMVELDGTNSSKIVGTGNLIIPKVEINEKMNYHVFRNYVLNFKFIVFCKDNKYKYSVENFHLTFNNVNSTFTTGLEKVIETGHFGKKKQVLFESAVKETAKEYIDKLIQELKSYMNKKSEDDW